MRLVHDRCAGHERLTESDLPKELLGSLMVFIVLVKTGVEHTRINEDHRSSPSRRCLCRAPYLSEDTSEEPEWKVGIARKSRTAWRWRSRSSLVNTKGLLSSSASSARSAGVRPAASSMIFWTRALRD